MINYKITLSIVFFLGCCLLGILGYLVFYLFIFPVSLCLFFFLKKRFDAFKNEYQNFLSQMEGKQLFYYTSRSNYKDWVESELLPVLDKNIEVILLNGKTPISNLPSKYISHALFNIKNIGFPNVMKVVNGEVRDASLHNEIYETINQKQHVQSFLNHLKNKLNSLN